MVRELSMAVLAIAVEIVRSHATGIGVSRWYQA